ncbi:MAG: phosphatidate cytidylyltransferase [Candidatus Eisenbacteria bacterium]|nr:phosphatidate cytidylyltransferase [Candidatus Eisenbacteria bacterium]
MRIPAPQTLRRSLYVAGGLAIVLAALAFRSGIFWITAAGAFLSGWEYRSISAPRSGTASRFFSAWVSLSCGALCVALARISTPGMAVLCGLALLAFVSELFSAPRDASNARFDRPRAGSVLVEFLAGPMYFGAFLAFVILLRERENGVAWIALLLVSTWGGDIGAYATGKALGRHSLLASVSPAKTVEGAIGGLVTATLLSLALGVAIRPVISPGEALWAGALSQALAQLGDGMESQMKRKRRVKDSGRLLGPQGGILDCIDGICLAAPFLYALAGIRAAP